jgi:hypothetical protein
MAYRFTSPQAARECFWEREMKATKMVRYADDLVDAPRCWDRGSGPSNGRHSTDSMKRIGQPTRSRLIRSNLRRTPPHLASNYVFHGAKGIYRQLSATWPTISDFRLETARNGRGH